MRTYGEPASMRESETPSAPAAPRQRGRGSELGRRSRVQGRAWGRARGCFKRSPLDEEKTRP